MLLRGFFKEELKSHKKSCEASILLRRRCENCGKTFSHKGTYERHIEGCGLKKRKQFECPVCGKGFSSFQIKKAHEETQGESPVHL